MGVPLSQWRWCLGRAEGAVPVPLPGNFLKLFLCGNDAFWLTFTVAEVYTNWL